MNHKYKINFSILSFLSVLMIGSTACSETLPLIGFTIQAGAFKEGANAESLAASLRYRGLTAVHYKKENGLYAVVFGNYKTFAEAAETAKILKSKKIIDVFYVAEPASEKPNANMDLSKELATGNVSADTGNIAARTAERFVGIPYRWGGNNVVEGMDCSGFVKSVYYLIGFDLPRTSQEQFGAGRSVLKEDMKEGDLVFFGKGPTRISHVGLYIGNNKFIHAPRRGEPIQITSLQDERYSRKLVGARRYLGIGENVSHLQ